ncbi:MAG: PQQ-binding-like beta-propeller repeat protein [Deltaproteobacteria bacterium]|nr:PQQ-binding-like beta-propeller repeat protein [Deltaproteobacteria bacterium]
MNGAARVSVVFLLLVGARDARAAEQVDLGSFGVTGGERAQGFVDWIFASSLCETVERGSAIKAACLASLDWKRWRLNWTKNVAATSRLAPAVIRDWVVVDTAERVVSVFERETGRPYWEVELEDFVAGRLDELGGLLGVQDGDRSYWALDLQQRKRAWVYRSETRIRGPVAFSEGHVFFQTEGGLVAVGHTKGERVWSRPEATGDFVAAEGVVYAVAPDDAQKRLELLAISVVNGAVLWRVATAQSETIPARICLAKGGAMLFAAGVVYGLSATTDEAPGGQIRFRHELKPNAHVVACDRVRAIAIEEEANKARLSIVQWDGVSPIEGAALRGQASENDARALAADVAFTTSSAGFSRQLVVVNTAKREAWQIPVGARASVWAITPELIWLREAGDFVAYDRATKEQVVRRSSRLSRGGGEWSRGVRYIVYLAPPGLIAIGFLIHFARRRARSYL